MSRALKLTIAAVVSLLAIILIGGLIVTRLASDYISPARAGKILMERHPDAVITGTETEEYETRLFYEIEFTLNSNRHSATIDGENGKILADTAEKEGSAEKVPEDFNIQAATEKAIADAGFSHEEVTVKNASLENENGKAVYDIEFINSGTRYEYIINAENGTVESITTKAE